MKNAKCRREPKVMGGTFTRHRWYESDILENEIVILCQRCSKERNRKAGDKMLRIAVFKQEGRAE